MCFVASDGFFLDTLFGPNDKVLGIYERPTLWKTDGTDIGTVMSKDVRPLTNIVSLNGIAYFLAKFGLIRLPPSTQPVHTGNHKKIENSGREQSSEDDHSHGALNLIT